MYQLVPKSHRPNQDVAETYQLVLDEVDQIELAPRRTS